MSMQIKTRNSFEPVIAHLVIHRIEQSGLDFEKKHNNYEENVETVMVNNSTNINVFISHL